MHNFRGDLTEENNGFFDTSVHKYVLAFGKLNHGRCVEEMRVTLVSKETGLKLTGNARPKLLTIRQEIGSYRTAYSVCGGWLSKNLPQKVYLEVEGLLQDLGVVPLKEQAVQERVPLLRRADGSKTTGR